MWSVSPRFLQALREPHDVVTQASVYRGGSLLEADLPVGGGSITVDEGSQVRRSGSITISNSDLDPSDADDLLAPVGTELLVQRGILFPEGDMELVPLGVFRVRDVTRSGWYETLSVSLDDRSATVAESRLVTPWNVPGNALVTTEIARLIHDALPSVEVYDVSWAEGRTAAAVFEVDRWAAVETLAKSIGVEVVFDNLGRCVIRPVVTAVGPVVWRMNAGPDGVLEDVSTGISRENVYNAVVASGDTTDNSPPVSAASVIDDGPLTYGGPFGRVPKFYSSSFITDLNTAKRAATSILARSSGLQRTVNPTTVVNPALDVGDTVEITLPDGGVYTHIISNVPLPLEPDASQQTTTRVAASILQEGSLS